MGKARQYSEIALQLFKKNDVDGAISHLMKALDLDSTNPEPVVHILDILIKAGKREEAVRILEYGRKLYPDNNVIAQIAKQLNSNKCINENKWINSLKKQAEEINKKSNFFVTYCWGSAATRWLSKVLNSHKEIFCHHTPFHRMEKSEVRERNILWTSNLGNAYDHVGFTHGISISEHQKLKDVFKYNFHACAIVRDPLPRINSAVAIWRSAVIPNDWLTRFDNAYNYVCKMDDYKYLNDLESKIFYHFTNNINNIIEESKFQVFKMEDLISDPSRLNDIVLHLTGNKCSFDIEHLKSLQKRKVNIHAKKIKTSKKIYESWPEAHKRAFHVLMKPEALKLYRDLGYEMPDNPF